MSLIEVGHSRQSADDNRDYRPMKQAAN